MLRLHSNKKILLFSSDFLPNMNSIVKPFSPPSLFPTKLIHTSTRTPISFISNSSSSKSIPTNGFSHAAHLSLPPPVLASPERSTVQSARLNVLMKKLEELGFEGHKSMPGQYYNLLCPMCKGGDSGEHSLSLRISENGNAAMWLCFRGKCGWQGNTMAKADSRSLYGKSNQTVKITKRVITEKDLGLEPLCSVLVEYFAERMISAETLRRNYVMKKSMGNQMAIAFTYRRDGVLINCKYRSPEKKFWQEPGTETILYGLDDIKNANDIIIVEGEIDKLAMEEAGFRNCVSVPDGAPSRVSDKGVPTPDQDTKYQYLWTCKEYFEKASRIILATDGDAPGQALAEELARRLGRERCWRVKWPKKNKLEDLKDANEVLMYLGPEKLKEAIDNAELYPIQGLFAFKDYFEEIDAYYDRVLGNELGVSTGWRSLDEYYNVVPGELTVVTGIPNSGKSEWIDALVCNLNQSVGWKFALCSMENKVREHARKLLEKRVKKPFFDVRYAESHERMTREDLDLGKKWLDDTFHLIRCENDSLPSIKWVLDLAKAAVLRHGVRGLVIDPYNELDHQRKERMTETEYVSQILTMVKRFAQHYSCHVWFVAHPRQLHNWVGDAPNLYDISGSAHFINKCDNGIVIHRNRNPEAGVVDSVKVCVRKVRNKVAGTIGDAYLSYNRITGEYTDMKG